MSAPSAGLELIVRGRLVRVLAYGDHALLLDCEDEAHADLVRRVLSRRTTDESPVRSLVPAARTVLVDFAPSGPSIGAQLRWVEKTLLAEEDAATHPSAAPTPGAGADLLGSPSDGGAEIEIEVDYDGADLAAVADQLGLSVAEVVRRHTRPLYRVQFCGFAPGFGYLVGGDPLLRLPRLATPRPRVPAGSVAISAHYTGIYPRSSPGGWRLLGRTEAELFDVERDPPALLVPGALVRLRASSDLA